MLHKFKYKSESIVVDLVLSLTQRIPAAVTHNLEKAKMLKMLFWSMNVDGTQGDYLEFGVAHGHSMRSAELASKFSFSESMGVKRINRNLHGFDTFEIFSSSSEFDQHTTWSGDLFNVPFELVKKRFRSQNVFLHKCNAEDLYNFENNSRKRYEDFNLGTVAALILFDMDLYMPTKAALYFVKDLIKVGTFLVFDEFYNFHGDEFKGETRALNEFLVENENIRLRPVFEYGAGGQVFICSKV